MTSRFLRRRSLLAVGLVAALVAQAQDNKSPIRLFVGFPPGGASDSLARVLADKLSEALKQPVMVENKPGIGGRLAAEAVKTAAPDGLTYMLAPNATLVFQHLTYPVSVLHYDMTTDFTSIAQLSSYPMAMVVNAGIGVKTAKEHVAWLKANPDKLSFGTAGIGGDTHFNGLQYAKIAGVTLTVVPYRGNGPLVTDLVGGQILTANLVAGDALQYVRNGKLQYIGVYAPTRSPLLPDVPTMAEQGFDTGGNNNWMGIWGPARLPKTEVQRMQAALAKVLALPEVKEALLTRLLMVPDYEPGAEVDLKLRAELALWGPVIKASGFKPQP